MHKKGALDADRIELSFTGKINYKSSDSNVCSVKEHLSGR
jgi:hypothetical protein